jgi:hypothetical protein
MQEDHAVCSDDTNAEQNPEAVRAPRHGLNAKALLLQAAAQAAQEAAEIEEHAPDTISAQDQEIAKLKAAFAASGKLLSGVPKRETPIVAFVNTTKASKEHHSCCRVYIQCYHITAVMWRLSFELTCLGCSRKEKSFVSCSADTASNSPAGAAEVGRAAFGSGSYGRRMRAGT